MFNNNKVNVELTEEDAILFVFFQQNYFNIKRLLEYEVFTQKSKTLTLHIDSFGQINGMEIKVRVK